MVLTSKDVLNDLYHNQNLTIVQIADKFKTSPCLVWRRMVMLDIPRRPRRSCGIPCSEETKKKISKANKGRIVSEETREKLRKNTFVRYGEDSPNWRGGRSINERGYVMVNPLNGKRRQYEHRLIAKKILGRKLKRSEVVHHINGNKGDNRNCNLIICDRGYHHWLHNKMSSLFMQMTFN